jgi:hypothetical protein
MSGQRFANLHVYWDSQCDCIANFDAVGDELAITAPFINAKYLAHAISNAIAESVAHCDCDSIHNCYGDSQRNIIP